MSVLEASGAGCWLVIAPALDHKTWHLRLDSAGWLADSGVSLRKATSPDAGQRLGGGGEWQRSPRYSDSIEVSFGALDAFMMRLAPAKTGLRGSAWNVGDIAPFESFVGPAQLIRSPCAT